MNNLLKTALITVNAYLLIPIFTFAADPYVLISPTGSNTEVGLDAPDDYIASLFTIFIVVAVVLSLIRLMICGIQYMTSESGSGKGAAKTCIQYVIGGLFLILISYVFLAQINKDLVGGGFSVITSKINSSLDHSTGNVDLDKGVTGNPDASNPPEHYVYYFKYGLIYGFRDVYGPYDTLSACNSASQETEEPHKASECYPQRVPKYWFLVTGISSPIGPFNTAAECENEQSAMAENSDTPIAIKCYTN